MTSAVLFVVLIAGLLLGGCASTGAQKHGAGGKAGSEPVGDRIIPFFDEAALEAARDEPGDPAKAGTMPCFQAIPDPVEPMNRVTSVINYGIFRGLLYPISKGYAFILPKCVRDALGRFGKNLAYPVRLVNTLLQGKCRGSWDETKRFGINTTVGALGLFDPAKNRWGIEAHEEDFGQTFGYYGKGSGFYFVLPLFGPSSGRDTLGFILDFPLNVASWLVGARPFFSNNDLSFKSDRLRILVERSADPYVVVRNLWTLDREKDVLDYVPGKLEGPPEPLLDAVFIKPNDPKFVLRAKKRKVAIPTTGKKLPYSLWLQKDRAPLAFVVLGLGAHRLGEKPVAIAELLYNDGFSVATISSAWNFEFINRAASTPAPGFTPKDCEDVVKAVGSVVKDIEKRYSDRIHRKALVGASMGAVHTLFLAHFETTGHPDAAPFDRYLAIDPPVDLMHGMSQLDSYFRAPLRWPAAARDMMIKDTLLRAIVIGRGELAPGESIPLSRTQSEFLIGLNFRVALRDVIYTTQRRENQHVLSGKLRTMRRQLNYNEIQTYSFADYARFFVFPHYVKSLPEATSDDDVIRMANLTAIESSLRSNAKVRVLHNRNDFLIRPQDADWLTAVLGDRIDWSEGEGHLGTYWTDQTKKRVLESLADLKAR